MNIGLIWASLPHMFTSSKSHWLRRPGRSIGVTAIGMIAVALLCSAEVRAATQPTAELKLKATPFKIAWEAYANGNSDIWIMNADGSGKVNLTQTPNINEHYPQISPDGTKIAFNVDAGEGRSAVRSLWIMDIDGTHRKKIADQAREPFWRPDGKVLGYLPQEYEKFAVIGGKKYSHTINPRTGLPVTGIKSVTIISPNAEIADAMATPVTIMGIRAGLNMINQIHYLGCIIIDDNNNIYTSQNINLK